MRFLRSSSDGDSDEDDEDEEVEVGEAEDEDALRIRFDLLEETASSAAAEAAGSASEMNLGTATRTTDGTEEDMRTTEAVDGEDSGEDGGVMDGGASAHRKCVAAEVGSSFSAAAIRLLLSASGSRLMHTGSVICRIWVGVAMGVSVSDEDDDEEESDPRWWNRWYCSLTSSRGSVLTDSQMLRSSRLRRSSESVSQSDDTSDLMTVTGNADAAVDATGTWKRSHGMSRDEGHLRRTPLLQRGSSRRYFSIS